ncbi:MAG: hypothetical protein ACE5EB_05270 [Thermodesulfobacteriota bacterium]
MKKFLFVLVVGFLLGIVFVYFGGADYIKTLVSHTDRAAGSIEGYVKKMAGHKKRAERVKKEAEEAGKRIEKYLQ